MQSQTEMKPWQNGFDMKVLQNIEDSYSHYNSFSFSPFTEMNKPAIARALSSDTLVDDSQNGLIYEMYVCMSKTWIKSLGNLVCQKVPGDIIISSIAYADDIALTKLCAELKALNKQRVFAYIWEEDLKLKETIKGAGFFKVCSQFKSTAEVAAVYCNQETSAKYFNPIHKWDTNGLTRIAADGYFNEAVEEIIEQFKYSKLDFANHYSNYNKGKAWSALALRGFDKDNIEFIEKPAEVMKSKKWAKKYEGKEFELADTILMKDFAEPVYSILDSIFKGCEFERIRLMKLSPGGGELARHSDLQDPDSGTEDGKTLRFHVPIVTNDKVEFSVWNWDGKKVTFNPKKGSMFCLDTRKPHTVVNGGDAERIHLVIDVFCNKKVRELVASGEEIQ